MKQISFIHQKAFGYLLFAITSVWSLFWVFFGLDWTDTFYFCSRTFYPNEVGDVFMPLTMGLLAVLNDTFGNYLIAFRIVNWLIFYLSYTLFYYALFVHKKREWEYGIYILSLAVFMIPIFNLNPFNGNALTVFALLGSFASLYLFVNRSQWWLVGLIAFITIGLLARFPNIVLLPMIVIFGWMVCPKIKNYVIVLAGILCSIALYLCINALHYNGIDQYFSLVAETFAKTSTSEGADHSVMFLLSEYLHTLKDMISDSKYLAFLAIIPLATLLTKKKWVVCGAVITFILAHILFLYKRVEIISDVCHYFLIVYFYAIICIMIFSICILALMRHDIKQLGWGILPLFFSLCQPAGSDTGLCLLGCPLYAFLPWLIYLFFEKTLKGITRRELCVLMLALVGLVVCATFYCRTGVNILIALAILMVMLVVVWFANQLLANRFQILNQNTEKHNGVAWSYIFLVVLCMGLAVYAKSHRSFHDKPFAELRYQHKFPELKGIYTNIDGIQLVNKIMEQYATDNTKYDDIYFFGNESEIFCYLSKTGMVKGTDFSQDDSQLNIDAIAEILTSKPVLYLIAYNPAKGTEWQRQYPKLHSLMKENGYIYVSHEEYGIFYPQSK